MANEITTVQGERKFVDFALTYSSDWSDAGKQGDPVVESEVDSVYFYVKRNRSDASNILAMSTASATEIDWVTVASVEKIRVKFGTNTLSLKGGDYVYELRLKLTSGDFISAVRDAFTVEESITGNPA